MIRRFLGFLKRHDMIDLNVSGKAAITFGLKIASQLLSFTLFVILARYLGVEGFGIYVFVWGWIKILMILGKNGMDVAATRYAGGYFEAGQAGDLFVFQRFAGSIVVFASLTIALGGSFLVSVLPGLEREVRFTFHAGFALLPFWSMTAYLQALCRVRQHMIAGVLPDSVVRHVIQLVLIVAVLAGGMTLDAPLAMATALGGMIGAFLAGLAMTWRTGIWRRGDSRQITGDDRAADWLKYGVMMIIISGSVIILRQIDVIMLGILTSAGETGAYGAATRIANLATFALTAVQLVIAPKISGYYTTGEMDRLQRLLRQSSALIALASFVIVTILWGIAPYILAQIGQDFSRAFVPLQILLIAQLLNALVGPVGFVLTMTGNQRPASMILLVTIVIDIVLNAVLIPLYGIIGAAIATAAAFVLWNVVMLVFAFRRVGLDPSIMCLFRKEHHA